MAKFTLALCGFLVALSMAAAPPAAAQQPPLNPDKGKNCRMEQQCHWENFKKICVWVKVCR